MARMFKISVLFNSNKLNPETLGLRYELQPAKGVVQKRTKNNKKKEKRKKLRIVPALVLFSFFFFIFVFSFAKWQRKGVRKKNAF